MDLIEKTENLRRHPWELSRSHNIIKFVPADNRSIVFADIGAGDRFFASKLRRITDEKVFAVDSEYKSRKSEEEGIMCLNNISLLENSSVDCMVMMDVLEHVEDEDAFLGMVLEKIRPGGKIIITVPAMQFLFSSHDVFLKHFRRYSRKKLTDLLLRNDIIIEQNYYFYTLLFILRLVSLIYEKLNIRSGKDNSGIGMWKYDEKSLITRFLFVVLNADFFINKILSRIFIRFPGLSLLAVCRKKS